MAKKSSKKSDRSDPKKNKSLAIRLVLAKNADAKAADVAAAVKKEYGHSVSQNMIYMVKTKGNMAADGRPKLTKATKAASPMNSTARWVEAITTARQLIKTTGSLANATAVLKAIDS